MSHIVGTVTGEPRIAIAAHGWEARIVPALGGAIEYLGYRGRPVLRAPTSPIATPREAGCFPMVPYANRIDRGRFVHADATWQLPPEPHQPHAMHGVGWKVRWHCIEQGAAHAVLAYRHSGDARWPWPFAAEQRVWVDRDGCTIRLSVTNLDFQSRPAGLGLHCFFPLDRRNALFASAERMWRCDMTHLPTIPVAADSDGSWLAGRPLAALPAINNPFDGWGGKARIMQATHTVMLSAAGAGCFHLYRPDGADFFAFEPIDHLPDALNRGAMPELSRGTTAMMTLGVQCVRVA